MPTRPARRLGPPHPTDHPIRHGYINLPIHKVPSLPRWGAGRTILIGDAAHAVAPHSGQGASMALEDAMFLAKLLRETNGASLERVFTSSNAAPAPTRSSPWAAATPSANKNSPPFAYWFQQQMIHLFFPLTAKKRDWLLGYKVE
jgi:2-polyprenyl-6-methoxyphenol hydroxylase-like FAD-dependent oxidoreductase